MTIKKYNCETHQYDDYEVPSDIEKSVTTYKDQLYRSVRCVRCGSSLCYGDSYSSRLYKDNVVGLGFSVCKDCFVKEQDYLVIDPVPYSIDSTDFDFKDQRQFDRYMQLMKQKNMNNVRNLKVNSEITIQDAYVNEYGVHFGPFKVTVDFSFEECVAVDDNGQKLYRPVVEVLLRDNETTNWNYVFAEFFKRFGYMPDLI